MKVIKIEVCRADILRNVELVGAHIQVDSDLSDLLPYLNATQDKSQYFPKGSFIRFVWKYHPVIIESDRMLIDGFPDDIEARKGVEDFMIMLNKIIADKDKIIPDYTPYAAPSVLDIFKLLPQKSGCGKCGKASCMAFAVALSSGEESIDKCDEIEKSGSAFEILNSIIPNKRE